jgi:hypothetical protein
MDSTLLYKLALFLHILGAFGLIAALAMEAIVLRGLRRAERAEDARTWLSGMRVLRIFAPASIGLILVMGLYMMATTWGPQGWILVGLAGLVLIAALGGALTGVRMARIGPAVFRTGGPLPADVVRMLRDQVLVISSRIRIALIIGILFLMSVKPSLVVSLVVVAVAGGLGLMAGQVNSRRSHGELRTQPN